MKRRRLLFAALAAALGLGIVEASLRLAGFTWQPVPEQFRLGRIEGGVPTGDVVFDRFVPGIFERDGLLF